MLIWFMHGASVRNPAYADPLRTRLIAEMTARSLPIPEFYSGYWGDAFGDTSEIWDFVQQDLEAFRWDNPQVDINDIFHYRQRREQLISGFFHDIFHYLSIQRGKEIRRTVAKQFLNFLTDNPFEEDLHIVVHSLSSVILWDILFSEAYGDSDPAFCIRSVIHGLNDSTQRRKVRLQSITTLGCPLLIFKQLIGLDGDRLVQFANRSGGNQLRWINVIHASDVFAYPLRASLNLDDETLFFRDHYLGEHNFLKKSIGDVTMALGLMADHTRYWRSVRVSKLVTANLLGEYDVLSMNIPVIDLGGID
ncbi:hypothetical protein OsccyDRAFT_2414 [Leptolyngbyaceae cyanobacterium JSC-12]|nr:hypothetical protein OsccyDRAFT_2414 [Leptolyngbyaceae cyanobacterium JSC-12]